jgi:hypothetical protein
LFLEGCQVLVFLQLPKMKKAKETNVSKTHKNTPHKTTHTSSVWEFQLIKIVGEELVELKHFATTNNVY